MLYRDDYYDPDSERPGDMDIIVARTGKDGLGRSRRGSTAGSGICQWHRPSS